MRFDEQIFFDCQTVKGMISSPASFLETASFKISLHDRFQLIGDFALRIIVGRIDHSISHDENLSFRFTMSVALSTLLLSAKSALCSTNGKGM